MSDTEQTEQLVTCPACRLGLPQCEWCEGEGVVSPSMADAWADLKFSEWAEQEDAE